MDKIKIYQKNIYSFVLGVELLVIRDFVIVYSNKSVVNIVYAM